MRIYYDKHNGDYVADLDGALEGTAWTDEFLDSWVCWREACEDVRSAYGFWETCTPPRRGLAFAVYRAALDREDQAAHVYSGWTDRLLAARR